MSKASTLNPMAQALVNSTGVTLTSTGSAATPSTACWCSTVRTTPPSPPTSSASTDRKRPARQR
ncbi:MAG: hypothetical protein R2710_00040 [Acidimicrobiales bacterium]